MVRFFVLKDYAKYYETKKEWSEQLAEINKKVTRGLFFLTILACCSVILIK